MITLAHSLDAQFSATFRPPGSSSPKEKPVRHPQRTRRGGRNGSSIRDSSDCANSLIADPTIEAFRPDDARQTSAHLSFSSMRNQIAELCSSRPFSYTNVV